jgi:hydrogenase/urease accessory protein HupE
MDCCFLSHSSLLQIIQGLFLPFRETGIAIFVLGAGTFESLPFLYPEIYILASCYSFKLLAVAIVVRTQKGAE